MPGMKLSEDITAFRRLVEAELEKLGVDPGELPSICAVSAIAKAAITYASNFHDHVMGR